MVSSRWKETLPGEYAEELSHMLSALFLQDI